MNTNVILHLGASKPLKNVCLLIKIHIKKDFPLYQLAETLYLIHYLSTLQEKYHQFLFHFFHDIHFGSMLEKQLLL